MKRSIARPPEYAGWMDIHEAAQRWGVSIKRIYKWMRGRGKASRGGGLREGNPRRRLFGVEDKAEPDYVKVPGGFLLRPQDRPPPIYAPLVRPSSFHPTAKWPKGIGTGQRRSDNTFEAKTEDGEFTPPYTGPEEVAFAPPVKSRTRPEKYKAQEAPESELEQSVEGPVAPKTLEEQQAEAAAKEAKKAARKAKQQAEKPVKTEPKEKKPPKPERPAAPPKTRKAGAAPEPKPVSPASELEKQVAAAEAAAPQPFDPEQEALLVFQTGRAETASKRGIDPRTFSPNQYVTIMEQYAQSQGMGILRVAQEVFTRSVVNRFGDRRNNPELFREWTQDPVRAKAVEGAYVKLVEDIHDKLFAEGSEEEEQLSGAFVLY